MTGRSYVCALTALIDVDDESLKAAVLGCRLSNGLPGLDVTDPDTVQLMLAATEEMQPERRMQFYLVNKYFVDVRESLTSMLEQDLPGARVLLIGVDATLEESD
ncbi:hypothetical protein [Trujillonella humicola]|uniref:hypothetical protein n=1 Tax=Trujillonella humicola TaxID=3383699 RepID=UPI0039065D01